MDQIILCNRSDVHKITSEARDEWIIEVLMNLGVPENVIEDGFDENANKRERFIYSMNDLGIGVELYSNGEVDVFKLVWHTDEFDNEGWLPTNDQQIVAQWKTPERVLKSDGKDFYYEIHIKQWSIKNVRI